MKTTSIINHIKIDSKKCKICNEEIKNYNQAFHHVKLNDNLEVDICSECIDKISAWQGKIVANLFPTKAMKKHYKK